MRFKKIIIIIFAVLFFISALTSYVNRIVFPRLVKKIAIERIEKILNRRVEIDKIHFNWIRGFIIDKIIIYEKDSNDRVLAQADQVSFGVLFFPGIKHNRITIPYINVRSPSVHLIRTADDTWNFSDIYTSSPSTESHGQSDKPSSFEVAWGGITISDGKFLVEDVSNGRHWSEFFDHINLKLSLSYKGISYDFTTDIPRENGFVGATVYYQPLTKNTQAQIHLKNIDTASYLSLINIPDIRLDSGLIKEIDLDIDYSEDKISAQGDVNIESLDITSQDQNFKGDIEIHHLDATYQNGDITAHGQMALSNVQTTVPGLSAGGSIATKVNDFELTKDDLTFIGSLQAQNLYVRLKDRLLQADEVILDNIRIRKDNNGVQSVGSIKTQGLVVQWPEQKLQGDISLKDMTLNMKDVNDIALEGEVQADRFRTNAGDKTFSSSHIQFENINMHILDQKNVAMNTKLTLNDMTLVLGSGQSILGSFQTDKLVFNLNDRVIKASSILSCSDGKLILGDHKSITANPRLELTIQVPLDKPQEFTYKGSITLSDADIKGFGPIQYLDNIELDADFQNDEATINALSINILDTNVRINGTVNNFKNPTLDILAEADDLNLSKIKDLAPRAVKQYGLSFDGTSFVKVQFKGLASQPLSGKILAVASVKNASVASSKFHQSIKNITGIVEATPNSLKWRDTTATYQGQKYSFSGTLDDFKDPKIFASIDGPNLQIETNMVKNDNIITINSLKGKYLNAVFNSSGNITLIEGQEPFFDISSGFSMLLEDLIKTLPSQERKALEPLNPNGMINMTAELKGSGAEWKNYRLNAAITSSNINLSTYHLTDIKINIAQDEGKINNLTLDGNLYNGTVHAVGSLDLLDRTMPYDLALNINGTDLHQFKMDSPLKAQEINGKFYLTTLTHGTINDFKNNVHATGSLAIRDGYLGEFNIFKGLFSVLNDVMNIGQVMITDVDGNFSIDDQKIKTDNLRLKGPTIVLLTKGWVNFDQICDLNVTVDLSSGVVPAIAHDVLNTLDIRIYDKISNPKFKKKISVPQVINTLLKNLLQ